MNLASMEKSVFNNQFGAFVRHKRTEMKWSQSKLASELGNNAQNISRIERGELSPTFFWVSRLAKVFGIELSIFVDQFSEFAKTN
jgi:ribosome-binding protein aMBF1 (putative translation factor)